MTATLNPAPKPFPDRTLEGTPMKTAEDRYFEQEAPLRVAFNGLADVSYPGQRAALLTKVYEARRIQARLYRDAFGEDFDETDGMDLAESTRLEALLYLLLADVERAVSVGGPRRVTGTELEEAAGEILDRMAAHPDLVWRARMLEPFADAVGDIVGGQAAEALWYIQSPGMVGWMTLAERDAWNAEHGYGSATAANRWARRGPLLLALVVAVASFGLMCWTILAAVQHDRAGELSGAIVSVVLWTWYIRGLIRRRRILAAAGPAERELDEASGPDLDRDQN